MQTVAVLVADPSRRAGLLAPVAGAGWVYTLLDAGSLAEAVPWLRQNPPWVLVVDAVLAGTEGAGGLSRLGHECSGTLVLVVAAAAQTALAADLLAAGAAGCILWEDGPAALGRALDAVRRGEAPIPGLVARELLRRLHRLNRVEAASGQLTRRERAVIECLAQGQQYKEIARALSIRLDTVRTYIRRVYRKLGVDNRTAAVLKVWRNPVVEGAGDVSHEHATSGSGSGDILQVIN